jgi:hypothetical protein
LLWQLPNKLKSDCVFSASSKSTVERNQSHLQQAAE